jgi:hypothetical protein
MLLMIRIGGDVKTTKYFVMVEMLTTKYFLVRALFPSEMSNYYLYQIPLIMFVGGDAKTTKGTQLSIDKEGSTTYYNAYWWRCQNYKIPFLMFYWWRCQKHQIGFLMPLGGDANLLVLHYCYSAVIFEGNKLYTFLVFVILFPKLYHGSSASLFPNFTKLVHSTLVRENHPVSTIWLMIIDT